MEGGGAGKISGQNCNLILPPVVIVVVRAPEKNLQQL